MRTDGRTCGERSRDYQVSSDGYITSFSYPWCSAARASRARAPLWKDTWHLLCKASESRFENYKRKVFTNRLAVNWVCNSLPVAVDCFSRTRNELEIMSSPFSRLAPSSNRDLKIEVWSFYCKRQICGLRLTVSPYTSAQIWNLSFGVVARCSHVCFHSSTYFYFSWEIVFKITFFWNSVR